MHELLSAGVQGLDILYIATGEESRGIKDRPGEREKEADREKEMRMSA